jgi:hypothetical protein
MRERREQKLRSICKSIRFGWVYFGAVFLRFGFGVVSPELAVSGPAGLLGSAGFDGRNARAQCGE